MLQRTNLAISNDPCMLANHCLQTFIIYIQLVDNKDCKNITTCIHVATNRNFVGNSLARHQTFSTCMPLYTYTVDSFYQQYICASGSV